MRRRHGQVDNDAQEKKRQQGDGAPADDNEQPPAPPAGEDQTTEEVTADTANATGALEARIHELEAQLEQERNERLRTMADFQNFRRRSDDQKRDERQFANRELILGLLPILDNFERALAAAEKNQSYEALVGGVSLTLRQMQDYLKKNGVEAIEAVGQEFDPNYHEAVARVEDGEHPENTVVDELQRGYTMHSRVLRPTMVRVATKG